MGEPENPGTTMQAVASFLGCPTSKALVREDFLIEVAGLKRLFKCNEKYDEIYMPRYLVILKFSRIQKNLMR
jgi:hypothetical protein